MQVPCLTSSIRFSSNETNALMGLRGLSDSEGELTGNFRGPGIRVPDRVVPNLESGRFFCQALFHSGVPAGAEVFKVVR